MFSRNVLRRFLKQGLGPGFAEFFPHTPIEKLLTPVAWISCAISLLSSECLLLGSHEFAVLVPSQPDVEIVTLAELPAWLGLG